MIKANDEMVNGRLCWWSKEHLGWQPYSAEELSKTVQQLHRVIKVNNKETTRMKKDICRRMNTIIGDYDSD